MDSWPCPEFRSGWDSYFKKKPDKPVMHYSVISGWFGDQYVFQSTITIEHGDVLNSAAVCTCPQATSSPCSISWNIHSVEAKLISSLPVQYVLIITIGFGDVLNSAAVRCTRFRCWLHERQARHGTHGVSNSANRQLSLC